MPPLPPVHQKMWTSAHPPIPQGPGSEQPLGPSPQRIGCGKSMLCYAFFRVMTFPCWTRVCYGFPRVLVFDRGLITTCPITFNIL